MTIHFSNIHWSSIAVWSPEEQSIKPKYSETLQIVSGWIRKEYNFDQKWIEKVFQNVYIGCTLELVFRACLSLQNMSILPHKNVNLFLSTKQRSSLQVWRSNQEDYIKLTANVTGFWLKGFCAFLCTCLCISHLLACSPALQPSVRKTQ